MRPKSRGILLLLIAVAMVQLTGCAGKQAFRNAQELSLKGDYDGAVTEYMAAIERDPNRHEYRVRLDSALAKAAWQHLELGRALMKEKKAAEAVAEFRKALEYDAGLKAADAELKEAERLLRADRLVVQADEFIRNRKLPQARANLDEALLIDPRHSQGLALLEKIKAAPKTLIDGVELDLASTKPITLKFKDTDVKDAFNILSKLTGVNFILDDEVKKQSFTFELTDVSFPQALELILQMHKLGKKVLNPRTIIIYSRSKDGDKQFGDQIIQTFYLSNIDAKKAVNLLRTMLQLRRVYVHEELNAIVVRDTADTIKLAGQMLEAADRADAEVMFELELIEVNHNDAFKFGLVPDINSTYAIGLGAGKPSKDTTEDAAATFQTADLTIGLSKLKTFYSLPTLTFDFLKTRGDTETLANPKIRVKNREKAKVMAGLKQPIVTVTTNGDQITENVQYVDVGVKLDIETTVQLDDSIIAKVSLEVSSLGALEQGTQSKVYAISTTNASTVLTLRDGERTILGGLINDDKSNSRSGIAFLSDLPLIGNLFTHFDNSKRKREIILSITPHIVQNIVVPQADVGTIWSGAEDDLKSGPVFGAYTSYEAEPEKLQPILPAPPKAAPAKIEKPVAPVPMPAAVPVAPGATVAPAPAAPTVMPAAPAAPVTTIAPVVPPVAAPATTEAPAAPAIPPTVPAEAAPSAPPAAETSVMPETAPPDTEQPSAVQESPVTDEAPLLEEQPVSPAEAAPPAEEAVSSPISGESSAVPVVPAPVPVPEVAPTPETPQAPASAPPTEATPEGSTSPVAGAATPPPTAKVELPPFEIPPAGDGRLVVTGPASAAVGDEMTFEVLGKAINGLYSAPLFVNFDPERFELVRLVEGDFLKQGGAPTVFTSSQLTGRGEVIVGYKQGVGGTGASGDGVLFRVTLRAKAAGSGLVRLDRLNLRNLAGSRLQIETAPLKVEIR